MANLVVGIVLLVTGTLIVLTGLGLAVAEVITGRKGGKGPIAQQMAGLDWTGIGAILHGLAALVKALADWPLTALLVFLGLVFDGVSIWVLASKPI